MDNQGNWSRIYITAAHQGLLAKKVAKQCSDTKMVHFDLKILNIGKVLVAFFEGKSCILARVSSWKEVWFDCDSQFLAII